MAADKISPEEAQVCFATDSAANVHNKCRAFAGWPGVWSLFDMGGGKGQEAAAGAEDDEGGAGAGAAAAEKVKLITTRVLPAGEASELPFAGDSALAGGGEAGGPDVCRAVVVDAKAGRLFVACGGGGVLELLEVQPPGKRRMDARSFANGLRGEPLRWVPRQRQQQMEEQE